EWVHVQLHQQKGMISLSPPTICNSAKTGTAEKLGAGGKYDGGHITYTAGVAPASRPEVALVVVINNPKAGQHFGGSVAAPVFGQIIGPVLTRLKIAPDALRAPVVHRQSG
ncbi:penicillin-binding transpeptidase domain-containing protein, partial [Serratia marcescens]|uniref:penicillin-binding transpeptidase domain-containing protein n=1 Tax=Serratia marcescens TaxID=615 RepID=UPI003F43C4B1